MAPTWVRSRRECKLCQWRWQNACIRLELLLSRSLSMQSAQDRMCTGQHVHGTPRMRCNRVHTFGIELDGSFLLPRTVTLYTLPGDTPSPILPGLSLVDCLRVTETHAKYSSHCQNGSTRIDFFGALAPESLHGDHLSMRCTACTISLTGSQQAQPCSPHSACGQLCSGDPL